MKRSSTSYRIAVAATMFAHSAHAQTVLFASTGTQADWQAAIDIVESPAVIVIPSGKWQIVESIDLTKDANTIIGAGMYRTRLSRDARLPTPTPPRSPNTKSLSSARRQKVRFVFLRLGSRVGSPPASKTGRSAFLFRTYRTFVWTLAPSVSREVVASKLGESSGA
ncbi:MAG TPA: hypothetical protein PLJ27_18510 [Polyangiaceae bacterium]|jgi:hypothetical protein|nr:hypothetical protein [Polyangiaceae bacterium]HNZ25052.1 hypothetical protein [Polyangiaceae bacterium]HOD24406.1 hypothetical protein [Polyangiaceae bacterium]HOE49952.1 hypothetical protein [Polyangiaceae bacterium]HOH03147.1 hypothetical protein [Polyangiaceae bacterium]